MLLCRVLGEAYGKALPCATYGKAKTIAPFATFFSVRPISTYGKASPCVLLNAVGQTVIAVK